MKRVIIIDDEETMSVALERFFKTQRKDFQVAGVFKSAEDALYWLIDNMTDLIVTDIKMGGISGIEMIETLIESGYNGRFIIISAYDNFEYVKKAMKCGVVDYLLKPVDFNELGTTLDELDKKIEERYQTENIQDVLQIIYSEICNGIILDENDIYERYGSFRIKKQINLNGYLMLLQINDTKKLLHYDDALLKIITNVLNISYRGKCGFYQGVYRNGCCYIVSDDMIEETLIKETLYDLLEINCDIEMYGFCDFRELLKTVRRVGIYKDSLLLTNYLINTNEKKFTKLLNIVIKENNLNIPSEIVDSIGEYTNGIGIKFDVKMLMDTSKRHDCIVELFKKIQNKRMKMESDFVKNVQKYLEDNIHLGIRRDDVATYMNYHPVYFSRQFSRMFGMSFQEYLIKFRIEKSLEYLKKGLDVETVAGFVGYNSTKYFIKNFKKYMGISPKEYYTGLEENGE